MIDNILIIEDEKAIQSVLYELLTEQHNLSFKIENINDSVCFEITLNSQNLNQN